MVKSSRIDWQKWSGRGTKIVFFDLNLCVNSRLEVEYYTEFNLLKIDFFGYDGIDLCLNLVCSHSHNSFT
jgi:hypothetical protein